MKICKKSTKILNDAFKSGDANLLNRAAHKIKGSVGNLAAIEAYEKAVELEKITGNRFIEKAEKVMYELEYQLDLLKSDLERLISEEKS